MSERPITILLADDHTIVRQGLAKVLEAEPWFRVVGEAIDGRETIYQVEQIEPDIVIMDITMPLLSGIEATRQIKKTNRRTKIIILSMHSHNRLINEIFSLGASGYLPKDSSGTDIVNAINAAVRGDIYLSPSLSRQVIENYVSLKRTTSPREGLYSQLSNPERQIFQMIA